MSEKEAMASRSEVLHQSQLDSQQAKVRPESDATTKANDEAGGENSSSEEEKSLDSTHVDQSSFDASVEGTTNYWKDMPLFNYSRILGSLPRAAADDATATENIKRTFTSSCQCSTMGRVVIRPTPSTTEVPDKPDGSMSHADHQKLQEEINQYMASKPTTFYILALGFSDGSIHLIDPLTGFPICSSKELKVWSTNAAINESSKSIVSLSFDSTSKYLSACSVGGDIAIFELHFGIKTSMILNQSTSSTSQSVQQQQRPHLFDTFLSKIAGDEYANEAKHDDTSANGTNERGSKDEVESGNRILTMLSVIQPVSTARFTYKSSVGTEDATKITCGVLDPSYERSREKSILVGFADGRLVLTKRSSHGGVQSGSARAKGFTSTMGFFLQPKRNDVELYVAKASKNKGIESSNQRPSGIETVAWRGSLISWADPSGVKVFDIEKMVRIAHIDRPTGARSSLYSTIDSLRPSLMFERSDSLLIAWGDCLMNMIIKTKVIRANPSGRMSETSTSTSVTRRKTVECEMAWELDCIASSVVPIDHEHVAVLGLVPTNRMESEASKESKEIHTRQGESTNIASKQGGNLLELQIISRKEGSIKCSDIIVPLVDDDDQDLSNFANSYSLASSFCTSRMEDTIEAEEESLLREYDDHGSQSAIFETIASTLGETSTKRELFIDSHLKWNMNEYVSTLESSIPHCSDNQDEAKREYGDDDSCASDHSEDSDDYTFLFRSDIVPSAISPTMMIPPTMVVVSPHDALLTQASDVDDAISYARSDGCHSLALKMGLDNRRTIRRQSLKQLIDEYLLAVLNPSNKIHSAQQSSLTIRRLKIAARATQILLGEEADLWGRWCEAFGRIPGGLFVLKPYIPVRDPKLSHETYNIVLESMLSDIESILSDTIGDGKPSSYIHKSAVDLFFQTLHSWGPTSSLEERKKIHSKSIDKTYDRGFQDKMLSDTQKALTNRMNQTSLPYLHYGSALEEISNSITESHLDPYSNSNSESLFHIENFMDHLKPMVRDKRRNEMMQEVLLNVMAELNFMKGSYDSYLLMNLICGARFPSKSVLSLEEEATQSVINKYNGPTSGEDHDDYEQYRHVLAIIEAHHLHQMLLNNDLLKTHNGCSKFTPIMALICRVGLGNSCRFMMENCILAKNHSAAHSTRKVDRSSSLPIHLVASQLEGCPGLLFWFLQNLIYQKPEIYTKFSNTAVPPRYITDLHRVHFDLIIKYSTKEVEPERDFSSVASYDAYKSPLLDFLQDALPHGGIRSVDVRQSLENCRAGDIPDEIENGNERGKEEYKHLFAAELAYIIERSGTGTEEDAKRCLFLYLESVSLYMAVLYAMRNTTYSSMLWESMVAYCLDETNAHTLKGSDGSNGVLFGSLLEVAARSGADLANLISKIPEGLNIEGIRPKLVSAISDYQLKLSIHQSANCIIQKDKISLLRSQVHRSRRGIRVQSSEAGNDTDEMLLGSNIHQKVSVTSVNHNRLCIRRRQKKVHSTGRNTGNTNVQKWLVIG